MYNARRNSLMTGSLCGLRHPRASRKDSDDHKENVSCAVPIALRIGERVRRLHEDPAKPTTPLHQGNFRPMVESSGFHPRDLLFPLDCDSGKSSACLLYTSDAADE